METVLDLLWLRIPPINYVCPPVCEFIFSGSSGSVIVLDSHPTLGKVTGATVTDLTLTWDEFPCAICYTVYKEAASPGVYEIFAECIQAPVTITPGCYRVSAITREGESDLSDSACTTPWILATGFWNDAGIWIDGETWKDN